MVTPATLYWQAIRCAAGDAVSFDDVLVEFE